MSGSTEGQQGTVPETPESSAAQQNATETGSATAAPKKKATAKKKAPAKKKAAKKKTAKKSAKRNGKTKVETVAVVEKKGVLAEFMDIFEANSKKSLKDEHIGAMHERARKIVEQMEKVKAPIVFVPVGEYFAVKILHGVMKSSASITRAMAKVDDDRVAGKIPARSAQLAAA